MPRYVDIDKLIQKAKTVPYGNEIAVERFKIFVNQNAEIEDVTPVIHAHWEDRIDFDGCKNVCSNCGNAYTGSEDRCIYCNAIMDEEE